MQNEAFGMLLLVCCIAVTQGYNKPVYSGLPMSVWRPAETSHPAPRYAAEDSETYGYVDRYPPVERQNPRYAFGVAHRFADTKADEVGEYDAYPDTPYLGLPGFAKRSKSYEDHWEPWVYDDNENSDEYRSGYYHSGPDPQDVVNFERYLQKYFDQSSANYEDEEWSPKEEAEREEQTFEQFRNDEDAATQLHSLISPRRPTLTKVLGLDRLLPPQKKSQISEATTAKATTEKPAITTTVEASTAKPAGKGQKEEALLRPPSPARTLASAEATRQASVDNDQKSIYDTIKKLFDMHSKLEDVPEGMASQEGSRMKRFVSQDDFFTHRGQHSFGKNKIKA